MAAGKQCCLQLWCSLLEVEKASQGCSECVITTCCLSSQHCDCVAKCLQCVPSNVDRTYDPFQIVWAANTTFHLDYKMRQPSSVCLK